jgi:hypothetical protein
VNATVRLVAVAAVGTLGVLSRSRYLGWGATDAEREMALPGDDLVTDSDLTATRAITVRAATDEVWPWIAQLGQGRGGFYSYDVLENLIGCNIHSADRIVPGWQSVPVGSEVNLHPDVALQVAISEPGRALVLRGPVPMNGVAAPYDFTWAFALKEAGDGTSRLVVRERYGYSAWWASLLIEPTGLISFVMSQRMLRGIKMRAESVRSGGSA